MNVYSRISSYIIKCNKYKGFEHSECYGLPILCYTYLYKVVLKNSPSDHET